MHPLNTTEVNNWTGTSVHADSLSERSEVVSKLIGNAFETARPSDRGVMLDHLLGSLGVLSLATIANGVFLNRRFSGASTGSWPAAGVSAPIEACDMRDLAQRVQQIDAQAIDELVQVFNSLPLSTTSPVGAILAELPLRKTLRHHED